MDNQTFVDNASIIDYVKSTNLKGNIVGKIAVLNGI